MLNLVFRELHSVIRMDSFFQQIALLPDCLYPSGIVSEKMGKTIGCEIVSLFKYINCKNAALIYL